MKQQFNICYSLSLSPSQSYTERHPEQERDAYYIAYIYHHKGLNRLQKFDFADLLRRVLAFIGSTCHGDEACVHCRKLTKVSDMWKRWICDTFSWKKTLYSRVSTVHRYQKLKKPEKIMTIEIEFASFISYNPVVSNSKIYSNIFHNCRHCMHTCYMLSFSYKPGTLVFQRKLLVNK